MCNLELNFARKHAREVFASFGKPRKDMTGQPSNLDIWILEVCIRRSAGERGILTSLSTPYSLQGFGQIPSDPPLSEQTETLLLYPFVLSLDKSQYRMPRHVAFVQRLFLCLHPSLFDIVSSREDKAHAVPGLGFRNPEARELVSFPLRLLNCLQDWRIRSWSCENGVRVSF
jgi:hypothetical protein